MTPSTGPTKPTPWQSLAAWLLVHDPQAFKAILARARAAGVNTGSPVAGMGSLGSWSSILDSIGSGISTAVSSVGSVASSALNDVSKYLSSSGGQNTMSALATGYLANNATAQQGAVLQLQQARAAAGYQPAAVGFTATGQPVYAGTTLTPQMAQEVQGGSMVPATTTTGQQGYVLNAAGLSSLMPSGSSSTMIMVGLGLVAAFLLLRKRSSK